MNIKYEKFLLKNLCLISFYSAHTFQIFSDYPQCRLFVCFDEKLSTHLKKEWRSFH